VIVDEAPKFETKPIVGKERLVREPEPDASNDPLETEIPF
jgi:hypothetical protein